MPCVTVIGHSRGAQRSRPTSLPAEARSACRWLRLLDKPELAAYALVDIIENTMTCNSNNNSSSNSFNKTGSSLALPLTSTPITHEKERQHYLDTTTKQHLITTLKQMGKYGWSHFLPGEAENRMALALQLALTHNGQFHNVTKTMNKKRDDSSCENDIIVSSSKNYNTTTTRDVVTSKQVSLSKSITTDHNENGDDGSFFSNNSDTDGPRPASMKITRTRIMEKESPPPQKKNKVATGTTTTVAVISDTSSAGEDNHECCEETATTTTTINSMEGMMDTEQQQQGITPTSLDRTQSIKQCWAFLLESLQLEVASRTTRVWGKKKIYEIYQLCAPVISMKELQHQTTTTLMENNQDSSSSAASTFLANIRHHVENEFRSVFHGGTEDQSGCRVYTKYNTDHDALYMQFNIGKPFDYQDEQNRSRSGEKKKKKGNEFVVLVKPQSSLIAVTASRAPSNSRFTPYVLTAIEAVLASSTTAESTTRMTAMTSLTKNTLNVSAVPKRFGDWTGTEPLELLQSAQKAHDGQAVGRFAKLAAQHENSTISSDPLLELHTMSTKSLVDRSKEDKRLETGKDHGRHIAHLQQVHEEGPKFTSGGEIGTANITSTVAAPALVVGTKDSNGLLMDHSATTIAGRKRARDEELGRKGDCPRLQRIAWKWTGETTAAATCWLDDDNDVIKDKDESDSTTTTKKNTNKDDGYTNLPRTQFKCGIVMEGTNVFEGLRAMVAAGLAKAPLPDFLRDAPALGSGTITVVPV